MSLTRRTFLGCAAYLALPPRGRAWADALLLGDSHAWGLKTAFAYEMRQVGRSGAVSAVGGSTAPQWATPRRLRGAFSGIETPLVLVSLGTNCVVRTELRNDVARLLKLLEGVDTLWLLPPKMRYGTGYLRDALAGQVVSWPEVPLELPMQKDRIHPTMAGYATWAHLLVDHLYGDKHAE